MKRPLGDCLDRHLEENHTLQHHTIVRNPCRNGYNHVVVSAFSAAFFWLLWDGFVYLDLFKPFAEYFKIKNVCFVSKKSYCNLEIVKIAVLGLLALLFAVLTITHQQRSVLITISSTITEYKDREILSRCKNVMKSIRAFGKIAIGSGLVLTLMYAVLELSTKIEYLLALTFSLIMIFFVTLFFGSTYVMKPTKGFDKIFHKTAMLITLSFFTLVGVVVFLLFFSEAVNESKHFSNLILFLVLVPYVITLVALLVQLLLQFINLTKLIMDYWQFVSFSSVTLVAFILACVAWEVYDIGNIKYLLIMILLSTLFSLFIVPVAHNNQETSAICQCFIVTRNLSNTEPNLKFPRPWRNWGF